MTEHKVLVLGATGLLGHRIIERLADRMPDARIVAAARHATAHAADFPEKTALADIDLERPDGLAEALKGVTDLVVAVAGRPGRFDAIEHRGVVAAATAAGVAGARLVVHISGTTAPQAPDWFEAGAAKRRAEMALAALPVPTVTLRPSWLMETLARFERDGGMSYFGSGAIAIHWLSLDDLADSVVATLLDGPTESAAYPVLGPQALSLEQAVARYAAARGIERIRALPMPVARLVAVFAVPMRSVLQLIRMFEQFDETTLEAVPVPFARPQTTLDQWLRPLA